MKYETSTIEKVEVLKGELDKYLPLKEEDKKRLRKKFRLEFNYNSNHIEGNTLTYGQTELLLFFDRMTGNAPVSDIEEMKAHDAALNLIYEMAEDEQTPLTEKFIKELNKIILVNPYWKDAITVDGTQTRKKIEIGKYKTTPNSVQLKSGKIHEYATPEETPAKMKDLLEWYKKNKEKLHPVQLAAIFHYRLVAIHPFDDGNGRVARLLMNYILLKNNFPPAVIKSSDKENYLTALQRADIGELTSIIEYIENQCIWSLELTIKAAKGEDIEELEDIDKELELLKREKLTESKIYKTPKIAYELLKYINDELWQPLAKMLNKFNDFFAESKDEIYIDEIKFEKKKTIHGPLSSPQKLFSDREVVVKPYEIFGFNLEEENISEIRWERQFLSLKTAQKKEDYYINCTLTLNEDNYILQISEKDTNSDTFLKNKTILFEEEREYKNFLTSDVIQNITRIASNHLIKLIRE